MWFLLRSLKRASLLALGGDDGFSAQVVDRFDPALARREEAYGGNEGGDRRGNLFAALGGAGRRAAFEVDFARSERGQPRCRTDRDVFDGEIVALEVAFDGIDDFQADVERVTDGAFVFVEIGERRGGVAVAENNAAGLGDLVEGGRGGGSGEAGNADKKTDQAASLGRADFLELQQHFILRSNPSG